MLLGHYVCPDCQSGHNRRSLKAIKVPKLRKETLNGARGPWELWLAWRPPEGGHEQSWRGNINLMGLRSFSSWDTLNKYVPSYFHSQSFLSQMILGSETKQDCMGGQPRAPVSRRILIPSGPTGSQSCHSVAVNTYLGAYTALCRARGGFLRTLTPYQALLCSECFPGVNSDKPDTKPHRQQKSFLGLFPRHCLSQRGASEGHGSLFSCVNPGSYVLLGYTRSLASSWILWSTLPPSSPDHPEVEAQRIGCGHCPVPRCRCLYGTVQLHACRSQLH